MEYIDLHAHVFPAKIAAKAVTFLEEYYENRWSGDGSVENLLDASEKAGISRTLIFSCATKPEQVTAANDYLYAVSQKYPDKFFAFGTIHPDFKDIDGELSRIRSLGMKGIKIHPDIQGVNIDDPRMYKLYELMEGRLPLYLHMGDDRPQYRFSETDRLVKVKEDFPKLEVVAAHLGGYRAWDEVYKLTKFDGMWYDTSSALWEMTPEYATELIKRLGTDRVMYGTDYPVVLPENEIERFMRLGLNEKEREDIFYDNAKRFLKF